MKRRDLCVFISAEIALSSSAMSSTRPTTWALDDGATDITPSYTITHTEGESFTFVRATFFYWQAKKFVELNPSGSIAVNGELLTGISERSDAYSYTRKVAVSPNGAYHFDLVRTAEKKFSHTFSLPLLKLVEYPLKINRNAMIKARLAAGATLSSGETLHLQILIPQNEFGMPGTVVDNLVTFENIKGIMLPTGKFNAEIYSQVKTPLRDISDAFATGWATASYSKKFTMEITS